MPALAAYGSAPILAELIDHLRAAGHSVERHASVDELMLTDEDRYDGHIVHAVGAIPARLAQLPQRRADKLLLFVENPVEEDLVSFSVTGRALLAKQGAFSIDELRLAALKAFAPDPFGLERYVPGQSEVQRVTLTRSTERGDALMSLDRYIAARSIDSRRSSQILTVADEFITNAFYHAPIDGAGGHPYSHMSRMDPVHSQPDFPIELSYAGDERRIAVAVRDLYGSLAPREVRAQLARVVSTPTASFKISSNAGGAGLGLIHAVRGTSQLIFNIAPRHCTECIGVIDTDGNYRRFLEVGRSLHLYSLKAPARS